MDLTILWLVPVAYFVHILEETPRFVPWAIKYLLCDFSFGYCFYLFILCKHMGTGNTD